MREGTGWAEVAGLWQGKEVEEGNLSLEGLVSSSSSLLHLSIHHNGKRERLKAIYKDMEFVVRGGGGVGDSW